MSAAPGYSAQPVLPPSQFAGTLIDLLDRVEYRRIDQSAACDPVYKLRYEAYRRENFVPVNSAEVIRDEFDDTPNSWCFGVHIDGRLVSSLRIHHLTPDLRNTPSYFVFPDVLDPMLEQGLTFVDPSRFSADHEASLAYPALPFLTLRIAVMATRYFNSDFGLHCVRPEHGAFYKRVLSSYLLAPVRFYHGLTFPMQLWATEAKKVYGKTLQRYPFFASTPEEREELFGPRGFTAAIRPTARIAHLLDGPAAMAAE